MVKNDLFERNILSLSKNNPELCYELKNAEIRMETGKRYAFVESRCGEIIPALLLIDDSSGKTHPLHSTIDPKKEAKRLIDTVENEGFLILLGLGGGFFAEAALERDETGKLLVIESGINGLAELLCRRDYTRLFEDSRFLIFVDIPEKTLEEKILNLYQPVLYGGIRVLPMRSRTNHEPKPFIQAANAINTAIERVSADYSVQAHFGIRWFSNIIRNLKHAEDQAETLPARKRVAVCAAGPSLSLQIPRLASRLKGKKNELFLIATDTSLPCLLYADIQPDAIISIDCQHISYFHFMGCKTQNDGLLEKQLLFADLASPPFLSSFANKTLFFSGGHPLTRYISRFYKPMPELDTSGGNVTHAAISLAEKMGAVEIELYGADFSYPKGICYAKGVYVYPYFESRQNRFSTIEAQASALIYRTPLEKKLSVNSWYYETKMMRFYRENLEEKSRFLDAALIPIEGMGTPILIRQDKNQKTNSKVFSAGSAKMNAEEFLEFYKNKLTELPEPGNKTAEFLASLESETLSVFATILPVAAALKKRHPQVQFSELIEKTKVHCIKKITAVLASFKFNGGVTHE